MAKLETTPVRLPAAIQTAIIDHAREGKPEEVCGILRGRGLKAFELIRGRNIAPERIENYDIDPQTLLKQFEFEDAGDEMMGIYHSHPVSVAYPSATDAWNAHYPDSIYFICSLEFDAAPVIRAFKMTPHFLDLDIEAMTNAFEFYETRPGLFAWFQSDAAPTPSALADAAEEIAPPFYVVFYADGDLDDANDSRVVSLTEFPIEIT